MLCTVLVGYVKRSHGYGKQIPGRGQAALAGVLSKHCSHYSKEHQIASCPFIFLKSDSRRSSLLRTNEHLCLGFAYLFRTKLKCFKGGKHSKQEIW